MLEPLDKATSTSIIQIRVACSSGNENLQTSDGKDASGHILWGGEISEDSRGNRVNTNRITKYSNNLWSDNYHDYELEWTPDRIILRVDGQNYEERRVPLPGNKAVSVIYK